MTQSTPAHNASKIQSYRQKVSELVADSAVLRIELVLLRKYPRRMVYSDQYIGPVAAACGRDETGIVGLVLWNEQIDKVAVGDVLRIESGWCRSQDGELVVSTGKNGRLQIINR
jgi:ssDNA-binding replication factor A large subunit